jgi:hypothetical protein
VRTAAKLRDEKIVVVEGRRESIARHELDRRRLTQLERSRFCFSTYVVRRFLTVASFTRESRFTSTLVFSIFTSAHLSPTRDNDSPHARRNLVREDAPSCRAEPVSVRDRFCP